MKHSIIVTTLLFKVDTRDYCGLVYMIAMNKFCFSETLKKGKI